MKTNALVVLFVGLVGCKDSKELADEASMVVGQVPASVNLYGTDCVEGVKQAVRTYESLHPNLEELHGKLSSLDDEKRAEVKALVVAQLRLVVDDEFKQACPDALPAVDELTERAIGRAGL